MSWVSDASGSESDEAYSDQNLPSDASGSESDEAEANLKQHPPVYSEKTVALRRQLRDSNQQMIQVLKDRAARLEREKKELDRTIFFFKEDIQEQ